MTGQKGTRSYKKNGATVATLENVILRVGDSVTRPWKWPLKINFWGPMTPSPTHKNYFQGG